MIKRVFFLVIGIVLSAIIFSFTKEKNEYVSHDYYNFYSEETLDKLNQIGLIINPENINNFNSYGKKNGIWLEEKQSSIFISSYISGQKDGTELIFDRSAIPVRLECLLVYANDSIRTIISFDPKTGLPTGVSQFIRDNNNPIIYPDTTTSDYILPYLFYSKYYDRNLGKVISEGYELLGDDWEIDNWMIGKWKFYDEDGAIEIRDYGL